MKFIVRIASLICLWVALLILMELRVPQVLKLG